MSIPWISALIQFALQFYLLGACWAWLIPQANPSNKWQGWLNSFATALALSLLFNVLGSMLLAEAGLFFPGFRVVLIIGACMSGVLTGALRHHTGRFKATLPGLGIWLIAVSIILVLPNRGELLCDGWDPGTYIGQGMMLNDTGSYTANGEKPDPIWSAMSQSEIDSLTHQNHGYTEAFRVIALDRENKRIAPYFFPLTPTLIAITASCAGLPAALKTNLFLGFIALVLFTALLRILSGWGRAIAGTVILLLSPSWIFGMHFITAEIAHATALFGLACAWTLPAASRARPWFMASALFALSCNRLELFGFGAIFLVIHAWCERNRPDRARLGLEHLLCSIALLAGFAYLQHSAPEAIQRLGAAKQQVAWLGGLCFVGIILVDLAGPRWDKIRLPKSNQPLPKPNRPLPKRNQPLPKPNRPLPISSTVIVITLLAMLICFILPWIPALNVVGTDFDTNIGGPLRLQFYWSPQYLTWPILGLALLGGILLWRERNQRSATEGGLILFLLLGAFAMLAFAQVAMRWPWLLRRYNLYLTPLLAISGSAVILWLNRSRFRFSGWLLLIAIGALNLGMLKQSWTRTEYNGVTNKLLEVAEEIGDRDLIVCDHFVWATPLKLVFGKHVLNGERIWGSNDPADWQNARQVLDRLEAKGWRIRFLNSTTKPIPELYPATLLNGFELKEDWSGEAFSYKKQIHQVAPVSGFEFQTKDKQFRLISRPVIKRDFPPPPYPEDAVFLDIGTDPTREFLGHGWSRNEGNWKHNIAWIKQIEADLDISLDAIAATNYDVYIAAAPLPDMRLRQNFGLYVNGHFVDEWLCTERQINRTYQATIPAKWLRLGKNRFTIRVGHLSKAPGNDSRELGIQVDKFLLRPANKAD